MADERPEPGAYFTERLPAQFDHALREQERVVETAQRVLDGMRGVTTTLIVRVTGEGGGTFHLNIGAGRLTPGDAPTHPVLLTLVQDRNGFDRLIADAGDSALGFLGGLTGLASEMKLTLPRVEALAGVNGTLRFAVGGDSGFDLLTHFGAGEPNDPPDTSITVDKGVYEDMRAGRLDAQNAFMGGKLEIEGDMQLAMQVALAVMAPD
jgi:hypothetical protein